MTNETARVLKAPLGFLGKGRWTATVFADGTPARAAFETPVVIRKVEVTAATVLPVSLAPSGGQAILFEPL
jgi:alpha-glucosidase